MISPHQFFDDAGEVMDKDFPEIKTHTKSTPNFAEFPQK